MSQVLAALEFSVPVRTVSLTNQRGHWAKKAKRAKDERLAVWGVWHATPHHYRDALLAVLKAGGTLVVRMTRIEPRALDDDNLRGALKSTRDEIAARLAVLPPHARVAVVDAQARPPGRGEVRVEITEAPDA